MEQIATAGVIEIVWTRGEERILLIMRTDQWH
jgi:hypothetical protein